MSVNGCLLQFPRISMGELLVRNGIILVLTLTCPVTLQAETPANAPEADLPSAEMLEFIGELDLVDEETWRLLEHHAQQDMAKKQEVKDQ